MVPNEYYLYSGGMTSAYDIGYAAYLKDWGEGEGKNIRPKHPEKIKRRLLIAEGRRIADCNPMYTELRHD